MRCACGVESEPRRCVARRAVNEVTGLTRGRPGIEVNSGEILESLAKCRKSGNSPHVCQACPQWSVEPDFPPCGDRRQSGGTEVRVSAPRACSGWLTMTREISYAGSWVGQSCRDVVVSYVTSHRSRAANVMVRYWAARASSLEASASAEPFGAPASDSQRTHRPSFLAHPGTCARHGARHTAALE